MSHISSTNISLKGTYVISMLKSNRLKTFPYIFLKCQNSGSRDMTMNNLKYYTIQHGCIPANGRLHRIGRYIAH